MTSTPADRGPRDLYRDIIAAWNARDAARMAAQFTDDGNLVGFDGSQVDTRQAIQDHLAPIFADHPTATYVSIVREVRLLDPSVAIVRAIAGMVPPGQDDFKPALTTVHTLVATLAGGASAERRWRAAVFQGTPAAWHGRPKDLEQVLDELRAQRRRQPTASHA
jgi:uncharacterized protein (TIGR02246 family)